MAQGILEASSLADGSIDTAAFDDLIDSAEKEQAVRCQLDFLPPASLNCSVFGLIVVLLWVCFAQVARTPRTPVGRPATAGAPPR